MNDDIFTQKNWDDLVKVLKNEMGQAVWDTLHVTLISSFFAILIGLPLGILLVVGDKKGLRPFPRPIMFLLNTIINILRSIPFLILMIIAIPLTRMIMGTSVGTEPTIVPLVIAAAPFIARLAESSLREVDPNLIEMSESMGAPAYKTVLKVMIPESIPSLIANCSIAVTTILGYTAMSGIIGGGGLGKIAINYGYYRYKHLVMWAAVLLLVILVQVLQSIGTGLSIATDKRKRK